MVLESLRGCTDFQTALSDAQSTHIVGPLVVSPVKAVVSIAEAVAGVALGVILALASCVFLNRDLLTASIVVGGLYIKDGLMGLISSILNMATFGMSSSCIHELCADGSAESKPMIELKK